MTPNRKSIKNIIARDLRKCKQFYFDGVHAYFTQQERAKYWPVSPELLAQYKDGTHTAKYRGDNLYWTNQNGEWHRDGDKPAYIGRDGRLEWHQDGKLHRDGDKPAIIYSDGSLEWHQDGKLHRDGDKPAFISAAGSLQWWQNDLRHRSHGPARIYLDRELAWWINGKDITEEVTKWLNGEEWQGTPEQIIEFKLRFT